MADIMETSLANRGMLVDPGDHFVGKFEVERKFAVDDLTATRERLRALEAVAFTLGNRETDVFLDTADRRLSKNGQQQVVRLMEPSQRVLWISKGPGADACVAMDLEGFDKALVILMSLGFEETGRLVKDRDIYFVGDFHVTLDRVPNLGSFVELAVMTDDEASLSFWASRIDAFAEKLQLRQSALQTRSYRSMLSESD
ncbi:class IV adenylate cyclase [Flavimaribacter sediminis]|nr:class IV adenylate cyclase [Flavimaribacter sediminis]